MFYIKHRSIKVTLFSEIHIKIFSKISLTYHQIAPNNLQDAIAFHIFRFQNSSVRKYRSVENGSKIQILLLFSSS